MEEDPWEASRVPEVGAKMGPASVLELAPLFPSSFLGGL